MIRKTDSLLRSGDHVPSFPSLVRREHCFCSQPPAPKLTPGDVGQVIPLSEVPRARLPAEVAQDFEPGLGRLSARSIISAGKNSCFSHVPATRPILVAASLRMILSSASLTKVVTLSVASWATVRGLALISWCAATRTERLKYRRRFSRRREFYIVDHACCRGSGTQPVGRRGTMPIGVNVSTGSPC
jgi:hypothetical protein